jgi:tetratricopeptide (TPR) repeat protein
MMAEYLREACHMGSKSIKLSLCMIVKNEAENLPNCLESVRSLVDEIVILDTGSTDDTIAVAEMFGAKIHRLEWPNDFAIARNHVLQYVTGDWVLVLDADETLRPEIISILKQAIAQETYLVVNLIRHEIGAAQSPYSLVSRLFRRHPAIKFTRPYHAMIDDSVEDLLKVESFWRVVQLEGVAIDHTGYQPNVIAKQDKVAKARLMMESFLAEHPDDPYVCSKLGALYLQLNEPEIGIELLQRGLAAPELDPGTNYELNYHLGAAYAEIPDLSQATHYYQQAMRQAIAPQLKLGAMHNLATLMQQTGELVMAEGLYGQVLQVDPNLVVAHYNLGMTLKQLGRFPEAIARYQQTIALQPDYAPAYQNLGVVLFKIGQVSESLTAFRQAVALYAEQGSAEGENLRSGLRELGIEL